MRQNGGLLSRSKFKFTRRSVEGPRGDRDGCERIFSGDSNTILGVRPYNIRAQAHTHFLISLPFELVRHTADGAEPSAVWRTSTETLRGPLRGIKRWRAGMGNGVGVSLRGLSPRAARYCHAPRVSAGAYGSYGSGAHAPRVTVLCDCHAPRVSAQGRGGGARKRGSNAQARLRERRFFW